MEWKRFWSVFHQTWGQCKESSEYNKGNWKEMQGMLMNLENDMKDKALDHKFEHF